MTATSAKMITNKHVAARVSERILEANRLLNEAISIVHDNCSTEEWSTFRSSMGNVLGQLLFEVVNPLYRAHPDLKPDGLVVPPAA